MENKSISGIISSRSTVRSFTDQVPSKDLITEVLEAGRLAPYAGLANRGTTDFRRFFVLPRGSKSIELLRSAILQEVKVKLPEYERSNDPKMQNMLQVMRMISEKGLPPWTAPWLVIVAERRGHPAHEVQSMGHCIENIWLQATALDLGIQLVSAINDLNGSELLGQILCLDAAQFHCTAFQIGYPASPPRQDARHEPDLLITWLD